jgi:hypothetical protein
VEKSVKGLNLKSFNEKMLEYKKQLDKGRIQKAYRELMQYFQSLRLYLKNKYPDYFISGSIYYGFMDMTYFSFTPQSLKDRKLKIAIVFVHEKFSFEVWLGGNNKKIQKRFWNLVREKNWNQYYVPSSIRGLDSILECILVENPDFSNLEVLTKHIEIEVMKFINNVEHFFSEL